VSLDPSGRAAGRGAYLCPSEACFKKARKGRQLERALKTAISATTWDELEIGFSDLCLIGAEEEL
jgi:predicted RNA-binding protein YlxR (DUF448 family)